MNLKEIDTRLRTFIASRRHDPADPLDRNVAVIEAQAQTAQERHVAASLRVEGALDSFTTIDYSALHRLRTEEAEAEHTARLASNALESVRRDIATATAARAERDVAALTPLFRELMTLADQQAESLVEVMDLLEIAHRTAIGAIPGGSHALQAGFAGVLTRFGLEHWRERVVAAGLLSSKAQKVA